MSEARARVSVAFTGEAARRAGPEGRTAVVIDVVRATTCIVEALANGARSVRPFGSVRGARAAAASTAVVSSGEGVGSGADSDSADVGSGATSAVGSGSLAGASSGADGVLLCGERGGLPIDGFDLGNSPREFGAGTVAGKRLLMKTTNGTAAFLAVAGAKRVLAAAFVNLGAVADRLVDDADDVLIVCAGKEGAFALDDAVCAGHLALAIEARAPGAVELDDGAHAATDLARARNPSAEMLAATSAGRALIEVGLAGDLVACADVDRRSAVPEMREGVLALWEG